MSIIIADDLTGRLTGKIIKKLNFDSIDAAQEFARNGKSESPKLNRILVEKNGIPYLSVVADSSNGPEWSRRLKRENFNIGNDAEEVLNSPDFTSIDNNVSIITMAIIAGKVFKDDERITKNIRAYARELGFTEPVHGHGCLIRVNLSDEDIEKIGLCGVVTMHGGSHLLGANGGGDGRWLRACGGDLGNGWSRGHGFAFVVSQLVLKIQTL